MFENMTFEVILQRMLDRVPDTFDKREGSVIYDALAPAATELAQMYIELDNILNLTFADTATGKFLERRTAELGIKRKQATKARRKGLFYNSNNELMDIPLGSRFRVGDLIFDAVQRQDVGIYIMECETAGTVGNNPAGNVEMQPIEYIDGLAKAMLSDIIEHGADEEDDESLRQRYFESLQGQAFGGNIADYKQKTLAIEGVSAVKVYPVWNGPGTVRLVILGANYMPADTGLVSRVQEAIDPPPQGNGLGIAPIGHIVTVESAKTVAINVTATIVLAEGFSVGNVQPEVTGKIEEYLSELRKTWQDTETITVRRAIIEAKLLDVTGIIDVADVQINGSATNLILQSDEVPVLGEVFINAG